MGLFQIRFQNIFSYLKESRICPIWDHSDPFLGPNLTHLLPPTEKDHQGRPRGAPHPALPLSELPQDEVM